MLTEPTTEKLKAMRLEGMMAAWREQQAQPQVASLSFDERLGLLIDAELAPPRERLHRACATRGEAEDVPSVC
jgi:IstB-like ATP binding protein